MSRKSPDGDRTLGDLIRTVRANAKVTVLACLGLMGLTLLVVRVGPTTYMARAQVLVPAAPAALVADPGGRQRVVTVDTEAHRAYSDTVMADVTRATGDADPRSAVRVRALPLSRVLVFEYQGTDRALVDTGLRTWTDAYVREQAAFVAQRSAGVLDSLEAIPVEEAAARSTALARGDPSSAWNATVEAQTRRETTLRVLSTSSASTVRQGVAVPIGKPWGTWAVGALMVGVLLGVAFGIRRRSDSGASGP